jgi:hypothetical protein
MRVVLRLLRAVCCHTVSDASLLASFDHFEQN